jgi:hypothetical protein
MVVVMRVHDAAGYLGIFNIGRVDINNSVVHFVQLEITGCEGYCDDGDQCPYRHGQADDRYTVLLNFYCYSISR